jgi:hypothetical protein
MQCFCHMLLPSRVLCREALGTWCQKDHASVPIYPLATLGTFYSITIETRYSFSKDVQSNDVCVAMFGNNGHLFLCGDA